MLISGSLLLNPWRQWHEIFPIDIRRFRDKRNWGLIQGHTVHKGTVSTEMGAGDSESHVPTTFPAAEIHWSCLPWGKIRIGFQQTTRGQLSAYSLTGWVFLRKNPSFSSIMLVENCSSLGKEKLICIHLLDILEKEMATHSIISPKVIPWTEKPGGLRSKESQRVRHDWSNVACMQ